jgi:hypothetical protein
MSQGPDWNTPGVGQAPPQYGQAYPPAPQYGQVNPQGMMMSPPRLRDAGNGARTGSPWYVL